MNVFLAKIKDSTDWALISTEESECPKEIDWKTSRFKSFRSAQSYFDKHGWQFGGWHFKVSKQQVEEQTLLKLDEATAAFEAMHDVEWEFFSQIDAMDTETFLRFFAQSFSMDLRITGHRKCGVGNKFNCYSFSFFRLGYELVGGEYSTDPDAMYPLRTFDGWACFNHDAWLQWTQQLSYRISDELISIARQERWANAAQIRKDRI